MDAQVFQTQTRLQFLRLGSNRLTALTAGTFSPLIDLQQLHLENNFIPRVPALVLPQLTRLYLHRNLFTILPAGAFDGLTQIQELHLEINADIRDIALGSLNTSIATSATPFIGLRMDGCNSSCVKTANQVVCACAEGFEHLPGRTDGCRPVDCGSVVAPLDPNAVSNCTTTLFESVCQVSCQPGFAPASPSASGTFTCGAKGLWEGSLECTPVTCPDTIPLNSTGNYSGNCRADPRFGGLPCNVTCEPGFVPAGTGSNLFLCGADGQWQIDPNFSCSIPNCSTAIDDIDPRANETRCPEQSSSGVTLCTARCNNGFFGEDRTYFCGDNGRWLPGDAQRNPGVAISCAGTPCNRSGPVVRDLNAFARCRGDNSFGGDDCIVSCRSGYIPIGRPSGSGGSCRGDECSACGANGQWSPSTLTCQPVQCSSSMANEMQVLNVSGLIDPISCSTRTFGDGCNASCTRGFVPKNVSFRCDVTSSNTGVWFGDISCAPFDCGEISSFPFDSRASIVQNRNCSGTNLAFDPIASQCSDRTLFNASNTPHRSLRCQSLGGHFTEDRIVECTPEGWQLAPSSQTSHIGRNIFSFCRRDCGPEVSVNGPQFEPCVGDTGEGATCSPRCTTFPNVVSSFTCSSIGVWEETTSTAAACAVLPTTRSPTQPLVSAAASESSNVAADIAVVIVPIIAVIILIIVVLYFFGYLRCLGLAVDTKRPGSKGTVKKGLDSGGASRTTFNEAYSPSATGIEDEKIYGSVAANFPQAKPAAHTANNPRSMAI